jgi:hypothetical protein
MENNSVNNLIPPDEESTVNAAMQAIAKKYEGARKEAWNATARRVSRRLLLSVRAQKLTCVCPISGIVSLLEVPAIPGFAVVYQHPLSELANARGLASRGVEYLRKLDTQTLAGILIVLADAYDLFRFHDTDTGAQKNALLRTAGKDILIDTIIVIEDQVHSRNKNYLPRLSLVQDVIADKSAGIDIRLHNYLQLLTESIAKPDYEKYDENAAPKKIGRPLYIRDVQKQERKLSYLARQEIATAKRELAADTKTIKTLAANLVALNLLKPNFKSFIAQLMSDNGMGLLEADASLVDMLVTQKLAPLEVNSKDATSLIALLRKDRSILKKEVSEEDDFFDDPTPGNESAVEDTTLADMPEMDNANAPELPDVQEVEYLEEREPTPPEGLSSIEKILWRKKWKASQQASFPQAPKKFEQSVIPSAHTYVPIHTLKTEERE